MKKWTAVIAVGLIVGFLSLTAEATVNVIPGPNEAHLKDVSHHFVGGQAVPLGYQLQGGEELRSIMRVDNLELIGSGQYWHGWNSMDGGTTGDEVTGLFYDLIFTGTDTAGALYYAPMGRNPLVAADDMDGDIGAFTGAWGGVIELYQDSTPDLDATLNGGSPPSAWAPSALPGSRATGSLADAYPTATDGSLWLSGVLLDLNAFGAVGVGYAGPAPVYKLTQLSAGVFSGLGYMNVFDGSIAASMDLGAMPKLGAGAGLADVEIHNTVTLGTNVWGNPSWEAGSSDPMRFDVIPEPTIMLLFGASILGGLIRRRF